MLWMLTFLVLVGAPGEQTPRFYEVGRRMATPERCAEVGQRLRGAGFVVLCLTDPTLIDLSEVVKD